MSAVWKELTGNAKYYQKHTRVSCRVLVRGVTARLGVFDHPRKGRWPAGLLLLGSRKHLLGAPGHLLTHLWAPAGTREMNPGNHVDVQLCSSAVSSLPRLEESLKNTHCGPPPQSLQGLLPVCHQRPQRGHALQLLLYPTHAQPVSSSMAL